MAQHELSDIGSILSRRIFSIIVFIFNVVPGILKFLLIYNVHCQVYLWMLQHEFHFCNTAGKNLKFKIKSQDT